MAAASLFSGCAAYTNPVANGIPVRLLPDELLAESRETYEQIDLAMLRQPPLEEYRLDVGDTLGIYVEGILGDATVPPPVSPPSTPEQPPSVGYPFPIRADGTLSLPLIEPITIVGDDDEGGGLTIEEAEKAVIAAYKEQQIIRAGEENPRIIVTLLSPRTVRVLVVREDGSTPSISVQGPSLRGIGSSSTTISGGGGGTGNALTLPVGQNDVLTALTSTGGLPGPNTTQEVLIYRGYSTGDAVSGCYSCAPQVLGAEAESDGEGVRRVIRIPLRKRCGTTVSIPQEDIILQDGDILTITARSPEFFYTGGLLPATELNLPFDYDLNVVEAVLRSSGPLVNGGINSSNLNGNIVGNGTGNPSPSQLTVLRSLPNGQQVNILVDLNEALRDPRQNILVQADDILLLQENRDEAFTRYFFSSVFGTFTNFTIIDRRHAQSSASLVLP